MSSDIQSFILANLGYAPEQIEPGKLIRFSTNGKKSDTSGWCRLFDDEQAAVFGCFRSGFSGFWRAQIAKPLTQQERIHRAKEIEAAQRIAMLEQSKQWELNKSKNQALWQAAKPIQPNDPVSLYLAGRGLALPKLPACLRYIPALDYWHDGAKLGTYPAMLAAVTAPEGHCLAIHRTYLTMEGKKADVPTVKKLSSASGRLVGASIKLLPVANGVLGVAEGIETALAASNGSGLPVWSTVSANGLASFIWPDEVHELVIFADNDSSGTGQKAAQELATRANRAGLTVRVLLPETIGHDWADVYCKQEVSA